MTSHDYSSAVEEPVYDLVVVGAGVAGALLAKVVAQKAYKDKRSISILVLEAGRGAGLTEESYAAYIRRHRESFLRTPNAPYPGSPNAPTGADIPALVPPEDRYYRQDGPLNFSSNATRALGGTTLHWMGITLRMMPEDFEMKSKHDVGVNWPLAYEELRRFYEMAEWELGVSADVSEQLRIPHLPKEYFGKEYSFPMRGLPLSRLDHVLSEQIGGEMKHEFGGEDYPIRFVQIPQARNSTPNRAEDPRGYLSLSDAHEVHTYSPVGPADSPIAGRGQRCEGNASCIPICPVQAKYSGLKTISELINLGKLPGIRVTVLDRAVATHVETSDAGEIQSIAYHRYEDDVLSYAVRRRALGRRFVLAGNAIENAKILLASETVSGQKIANSSGELGRNLMDHPFVLTWAMMPEGKEVYGFRGPGVTSDIPVRAGSFRNEHAAFRTDVGNWGWGLADDSPRNDIVRMTLPQGNEAPIFGEHLKKQLRKQTERQIVLGFLVEQLPDPKNRVTIDDAWRDRLGNFKPVLHYNIDDYCKRGMLQGVKLAGAIYDKLGASNHTNYEPNHVIGEKVSCMDADGQEHTIKYIGAGHIMGTHRMGDDRSKSVVDKNQRSWDHNNLYIVGCGSMPTAGTSNPTLTAAALSVKSAYHLYNGLKQELAAR